MQQFSVRVLALLVLTAAIAVVDAMLPPEMTASLLYVALVLLAASLPEGYWTWIAAGVGGALSFADFLYSLRHSTVLPSHLLGNLILTLFAITVTALLSWRRRGVEQRLRQMNAALDENIAKRTSELSRAVYDLQAEVLSRKRVQADLEQEASLLKGLMDAMPDHIYFKDRQGRYLRINDAKAHRSGLATAEEAIGKTDYDYFPKSHADAAMDEERQVMETGEPIRQEHRLVWPDGRVTWSSATKVPLRSSVGEIVGTLGISHDVTTHHELAETLQLERDRLRTLIDNLPDLVFIKDANFELIAVNHAYLAQFGLDAESQVVGKTESDFCPRGFAEFSRQSDEQVLSTGEALVQQEELFTTLSGAPQWKITTRIPLRDLSGEIIGLVGICHDITGRKHSERALQESEWLYHSLVDNLPVYVVRKDLEGRVTYANANACTLYGMPYDRVIGKTDHDFFPKELADKYRRDDQKVLETGEVFSDIEENRGEGGRFNYFEVRKTPVREMDGKIVGVQLMFWDVTVRQNALKALAEAKDAAESANRAKSEFLANMSHEIRTPMNAIIGMTELVLETRLMPEQRDFLQTVRDSGLSLLSIINDILDFSKIEAGRLELESLPFDLRETLGDALKAIGLRAHVKGLELACDIHNDVPRVIVGDALRMRQVIINLVGNAVKFTERGEVVITCGVDVAPSEQPNHARLRFSVRDTGIGISPEQQSRIFRAFEQADMSLTRRFGGTGLGLAISSRIIQQMGGRIQVESDAGKGSTFYFTVDVPLGSPEDVTTPVLDSSRLTGLRILIVDDNATNRRILEEMCRNWHMLPTAVGEAETALDLLRKAARQGPAFDLVITDASMPEVDGFTLADHIHQDHEIRSTLVMMLTSLDRMGDATRCEELGIKSYLVKPVKQSDLFDAIVLALEGERRGPAVSPISPETLPRLRRLNILLAEDSLANQKLAKGLLTRWGHDLTIVNNGLEAVAAVRRRDFDLVLMDVQMPELDGMEATQQIREFEKETTHHIPIIAMTAHAMKGDKERCLAAGMDSYCPKPIRPRELHDAIVKVVPSALNVSQATVSARTPDAPDVVASTETTESLFDWPAAIRSMQGDEDLLFEVIDAHLEECPIVLDQLLAAITAGDCPAVRRFAHTLKGNCRALHVNVPLVSAVLEEEASHGDLSQAAERLTAIQAQLEAVNSELRDRIHRRSNAST